MHENTATLHVRSGRHQGATVSLTKDLMRVGCDPNNDIVLSDEGIGETHFSIRMAKSAVEIVAKGASLQIDQQKELPSGYRALIKQDTLVSVGVIDLEVRIPTLASPKRVKPSWLAVTALVAGFTVGPLGMVGLAQSQFSLSAAPILTLQSMPEQGLLHEAALPEPTEPVIDPTEEIESKLEETGLSILRLAKDGQTFTLSGTIKRSQMLAWRSFQHWFDANFPSLMLQVENVRVGPEEPEIPPWPNVQSIWAMGTPYAVIDGRRVFEGNSLSGGWVVGELSAGKVSLKFKGKTYWLGLTEEQAGQPNEG